MSFSKTTNREVALAKFIVSALDSYLSIFDMTPICRELSLPCLASEADVDSYYIIMNQGDKIDDDDAKHDTNTVIIERLTLRRISLQLISTKYYYFILL